jgi:outer membrane lipoprotein SlyB
MAEKSTHRKVHRSGAVGSSLMALALLSGCVAQPVRTVPVYSPPAVAGRPYIYPGQGQSPAQIERDRYECYLRSVQQTGVDPNRAARTFEQVVIAPAPGTGTATGAVGGAILGSLLAGPRSTGLGFLLGGATGAIVGSAADANAQAQVAQAQTRVNEARAADLEHLQEFQRANSACLAARGYSVS